MHVERVERVLRVDAPDLAGEVVVHQRECADEPAHHVPRFRRQLGAVDRRPVMRVPLGPVVGREGEERHLEPSIDE